MINTAPNGSFRILGFTSLFERGISGAVSSFAQAFRLLLTSMISLVHQSSSVTPVSNSPFPRSFLQAAFIAFELSFRLQRDTNISYVPIWIYRGQRAADEPPVELSKLRESPFQRLSLLRSKAQPYFSRYCWNIINRCILELWDGGHGYICRYMKLLV